MPSQCARAAARRRDRCRADSVDRVSARPTEPTGSCRIWRSRRAGRWHRWRCTPRRPMPDVRSIAMDTSSRTSVALVRVLCARAVRDRAGDRRRGARSRGDAGTRRRGAASSATTRCFLERRRAGTPARAVEKIDLGEAWTRVTGLPFVYAFWAGGGRADSRRRRGAAGGARRRRRAARQIARAPISAIPTQQAIGARYLRDNIKYRSRAPRSSPGSSVLSLRRGSSAVGGSALRLERATAAYVFRLGP